MLKGITTSSRYIQVLAQSQAYIGVNGPMSGTMRYNNGRTEVFDGSMWLEVGCFSSVSLTSYADTLLDWVAKKKAEEETLEVMLKKYPALKTAKDQYDIVKILCESDHTTESNQ